MLKERVRALLKECLNNSDIASWARFVRQNYVWHPSLPMSYVSCFTKHAFPTRSCRGGIEVLDYGNSLKYVLMNMKRYRSLLKLWRPRIRLPQRKPRMP